MSNVGGGGNNEHVVQPSPAKPTWAQILNSNPNTPSNQSSSLSAVATTTATANTNIAAAHNSPSSSSPTSQHSTTAKAISPSGSGALNVAGGHSGFTSNFYEQQQSQMKWSLNFSQTSPWMTNDDDAHRQLAQSSEKSHDNTKLIGDGTIFSYI